MKTILLSLFISIALIHSVTAQERSVSGSVFDGTSGEGLPGATVQIKGTTNGTITDFNGQYKLSVTDEAVLIVNFIGYTTQEVAVGNQSVLDITLVEDVAQLDEIVVIGYGVQRKKVVTGAIESVSAEEISLTPILRVEQALQGRTPGVQVTNQSGQPGEAPTVRIRGAGTTGNAAPLYIVDGLPVGGIDFLNPGDIESMDVLKDAASAAIYGSRAANGVVLITTKSGVKGKMSIAYSGYYASQNAAKTIDMLNADQYRALMNEGATNAGLTEPFDLNEIPANNTDWQEALFQNNAPMVNHQLSVAGGSEKSTYASSLSYFTQEGIIGGDKSQFERITARLNTNHKVNSKFNFGNNLAYTHIVSRGIASNSSFNGAFSSAINMDPLTPVVELDPTNLSQTPYSDEPVVLNGQGQAYGVSNFVGAEVVNPLALLELANNETRVDKLVGNIYGELVPIDGLNIKSSFGIDLAYVLNDGFRPLFYLNGAQLNDNKTDVNKAIERNSTWQWENTATYTKKIGDHNLTGLVGISALQYSYEDLRGSNAIVPTDDPDNVYLNLATDTLWRSSGGAARASLYSNFGRVSYDYKDKYSFTGIIRRDGSSKFGANKRFGTFSSVGAAWVASDEDFMQNLGPVSFLKLRVSYGVNGNQEIGDYAFVSIIDNTRGYTFADGRVIGSSPLRVANADIQWEGSKQLSIGIDTRAYNDRLSLTVDYYKKTTDKLLEIAQIPDIVGRDASFSNVGIIENSGIEIGLNWRNSSNELNYSFGLNTAYNRNQITNIANDFIAGASWAIAGQVTRNEVGQPIAYFWGYKTAGLFQNDSDVFSHINTEGDLLQPNAVPGDVRFVDVNGDGVIDPEDRTKIGNPTPDWTFGFDASADYKNFDFSILFIGSLGNDIFNGMQRQDLRYTNRPTTVLDRWTGEGTSNSEPRFTWVDTNNNYRVSDLYIENGSFMRLKNIQFGYNIPNSTLKKIGATAWRFYVSGENLITFTGYTGADPEIGAQSAFDIGIDRAIYPQARTFRIGTSLTF
jgi:TonB-linked SusC/RagA family outer membrane protein